MQKEKYLINTKPPSRHDFLKDLVGQFRDRRIELDLTQDDVDCKMGNAERTCSKWECGSRTPTSFNLYCWAEVIKCKLELIAN